ncbi:hypothetical protein Rhe02_29100 [Rhizocola hellebori]|uniref:Uncharacterized protein n=1 Tax=Rhizocola hellebori TaxID=1392758 RepID=A0A8J3VGF6_9ACTN|nr:hypothetical protein [Rhizocola hellebori]GIH04843.1 hypothetical protein Rhe02_29100 [Rhizocola hellebori]
MTTNAEILAKADEVAALVRQKYFDELYQPVSMPYIQPMPGDPIPVQIAIDPEPLAALADVVASTIRPEFVWFTEPDPERVAAMRDSLRYITGSFQTNTEDPALGYIDEIHSNTAEWYGSAAEAFRLNFLGPLTQIRHNQVALVAEFATVLEGYEKILTESRAKIIEIGDRMIVALNALPGGGTPAAVMFSIAALVVGILAAMYGGGPVLTVPLAVLGNAMSLGADSAGVEVGGGNVQGVLDSMNAAITQLKQDMADAETILVDVLTYDAGLLATAQNQADNRQLNPLVSLRPNVIDVIGGTDVDFEHTVGN